MQGIKVLLPVLGLVGVVCVSGRGAGRCGQRDDVRKGVFELEAGEGPLGRVRRPGGGRKRVAVLALVGGGCPW
ncbi:hypothetical protein GCM10010254_46270 [Streptomyces chromofuscus]|nr:hypothetical protein GCM10010254_46270 [Streptomyces chromofuscus]